MEQEQIKRAIETKEEPYVVCSICGFLVKDSRVTLEFEAVYTDYKKHTMGQWHLVVCEDCAQKLNEIEQRGEEGALQRMKKIGMEHL